MEEPLSRLSDGDILFLIETVEPRLEGKLDAIKSDPTIVEAMLDHETGRLFERIMLMGDEAILARISPRLLFEVLLREALRQLESQSYTVERTASQRIAVFDTKDVVEFLTERRMLDYLADMLVSFTRVESFTVPVRVRKGVWRKVRFSDMDVDSLVSLCEAADEGQRFGYYKRIADLCLFILGMFPEYAGLDPDCSPEGEARPALTRRLRRSAADFEEEGRRFYRLAGEDRGARMLDLTGVLWRLHHEFHLAKKPLNYISDNFLQFKKQQLFPSRQSQ
ncbi:MAG: hypothetical protein SVP26_02545 [Chloroflexota bacterium]|nr:hypothetical protein [Chloroflexota bacterium]